MKKIEKRWLRKARRVFTSKNPNNQWDRAVDLARDIWRNLDPVGWKKLR